MRNKSEKFKSIIFLMLLWMAAVNAQQWEIVQVDTNGIQPRIAVDSQDRAQLVYMTRIALEDLRVINAIRDLQSGLFIKTIVDSGTFETQPDIEIDENDFAHLVYHQHLLGDLQYTYTPDGVIWINETILNPNHDGWSPSIALNSQGYPHCAYIDPGGVGNGQGIEYAWFDGTDWTVETIGSEPELWLFNGTSIRMDSEDRPHIAYSDDILMNLMLASKSDTGWTNTIVDSVGDTGRFMSMQLDEFDNPHIGYFRYLGDSTGVVKYAEYNGSQWFLAAIDTLDRAFLGERVYARDMVSIDIDSEGLTHMTYSDEKQLKYAILNRTTVVSKEVVIDYSNNGLTLGQSTSMELDSEGMPHVTFFEVGTNVGTNTLNITSYARKKPIGISVSVDAAFLPLSLGDTLHYDLVMANYSTTQQSSSVWTRLVWTAGEITPFLGPKTPALLAKTVIEKTPVRILPTGLPAGQIYQLIAYMGSYDADPANWDIVVSDTFEFELTAALADNGRRAQLGDLPLRFGLDQNYPNPFNPTTDFRFRIADFGFVEIKIYDIQGKLVKTLIQKEMSPGSYTAHWDGTNKAAEQVASGIYVYRMTSGDFLQARKMMLTR